MTTRVLGGLQVATMLVSASYGIGFLFGSGELALSHGMAGGLYGVATAVGMLVLALLARPLWILGVPIWDVLGRAYGRQVQRIVALLSVVWMAGVLAAQIQGAVAVTRLLGLDAAAAQILVLLLIFCASRLDLSVASRLFGGCLLVSGVVLVWALIQAEGVGLYLQGLPAFVTDLPSYGTPRLMAVSLGVGLMAVAGSDYHQFVQAARSSASASGGCLLAAVLLVGLALLPPAMVMAMTGSMPVGPVDGKQIVPHLLAQAAGTLGPNAAMGLLAALSTAALGSGAAILRAMSSALGSAMPGRRGTSALALFLGAAIAGRGQAIVDTMVSVNMVYLASITVCAGAVLVGKPLMPARALAAMGAGFAGSAAIYVASWSGLAIGEADLVSLSLGLVVSAVVAGGASSGSAVSAVKGAGERSD